MPADSATKLTGGDPLAALFPDESVPEGSAESRRRARGRRRVLIVLLVVAVVVAVIATRAVASGGPSYETATVEHRTVGAILDAVATVEPMSQAAVAFPTSGTVATVSVKVGDQVTAGQTLAALDTTSLEQTLHEKEAALASAELSLEKATSGQSVSLPNSAGASGGAAPSGNGSNATLKSVRVGASGPSRVVLTAATSDPELQQAQQAVLTAQHQVDVAIAAASAALDHATAVCADVGVDPSTTTTSTTAPVSTTVPADALAACQQALDEVLTAQKAVQTAQASLVDASKAYDDLLAQRAASSGSAPGGSAGDTTSGGPATSGAPTSGFSGSTGPTSSAPSSTDLVAFQKAVDAAQDQVAVAQQAVAQATIASPIDGTVVSVTLVSGDTVTAASTTANVVVKGGGGFQATSSVSVTKIAKLEVGQPATVLPDGGKTPIAGKVVAISAAPTTSTASSSASSPTYRVVVALDASKDTLQNGDTADLTIVTDASKAGLAVPTTAITTTGSRHTVTVLDGDTTRTVTVEVGTMGPTWTVVKRGLTEGEQVVLADNETPLPNSATSSSNSTTGTGTFPGAGSFPGGGSLPTFSGPRN